MVGLSPRIAETETLKKPEYFGKYGRIHKVVVGAASTAQVYIVDRLCRRIDHYYSNYTGH